MSVRAFDFVPRNHRPAKPRKTGLTEIRGPYYDAMGTRRLNDLFETMGEHIDGLKFAGGSFSLMPRDRLKEMIDLAHEHGVYVSTGGWAEFVLTKGPDMFRRYIEECANIGFDVVELSFGFITLPEADMVRLVEDTVKAGVKAKPELGIQIGAGGGDVSIEELEAQGTRHTSWVISRANACLEAGADIIMIESEGITENVTSWRTDVVNDIINGVGLENCMFEAAEPQVFEWYIRNFGIEANLFVDHSQIVQLECLRSGIWGTPNSWGRILTYR